MSSGKYLLCSIAIALTLMLVGCQGQTDQDTPELTIFAAASLTNAFAELGTAFTTEHNIPIRLNFAGSSQLAAQISEGAPADIFASANPDQMQVVIDNGRIDTNTAQPFVSNTLAIITPIDTYTDITQLADLATNDLDLILATEGVPVRTYTDQAVQASLTAEQQTAFYSNIVSAEDNVRQVAAKIALGEADAGIVYVSDVTPDIQNRVRVINVPAGENIDAIYTIAPLNDTAVSPEATQFIDFVLSPRGQAILASWGFAPPPTP